MVTWLPLFFSFWATALWRFCFADHCFYTDSLVSLLMFHRRRAMEKLDVKMPAKPCWSWVISVTRQESCNSCWMLHGKKEFSHYASFAIAEVELAWKKGVQGAAASEQHWGWPYGTCMQSTGKDNFLHRVITLLLHTLALLWKCLEHALPVQHSQPVKIQIFQISELFSISSVTAGIANSDPNSGFR